jgi:hypothetical protein
MNKSWFYLGVMSSLAIFITSCGGDGGKQATTLTPAASKSPTAVASPTTAAVPPTTPKPTPTAAKPLTVPAKSIATKAVSMNVAAGLIPPTDPDNWTKTVAKGRPDPFAALALQPIQDPKLIKELANTDSGLTKNDHKNIRSSAAYKYVQTKGEEVYNDADKQREHDQMCANASQLLSTGSPDAEKVNAFCMAVDAYIKKKITKEITAAISNSTSANQKHPITKVSSKVENKSVKVVAVKAARVGTGNRQIDISQIPRSGIDRKLPKITIALKPGSPSERSTTSGRSGSTSNIAIKPLPQPLATSSNSTKLARSIGVSGVIEVDGRTQVIVKLPNESFSRYVDVGSRISDGKIMVKRVEGEQTLSPIIVLEESGIEITRRVGDTNDAAAISNTNNNSSNVKIPPK